MPTKTDRTPQEIALIRLDGLGRELREAVKEFKDTEDGDMLKAQLSIFQARLKKIVTPEGTLVPPIAKK